MWLWVSVRDSAGLCMRAAAPRPPGRAWPGEGDVSVAVSERARLCLPPHQTLGQASPGVDGRRGQVIGLLVLGLGVKARDAHDRHAPLSNDTSTP